MNALLVKLYNSIYFSPITISANGYQKQFDKVRQRGEEPIAPNIPEEIIDKMTQRYTTAYERTTGKTL